MRAVRDWTPFDPAASWKLGAQVAAMTTAVLGGSLLLSHGGSPLLAWTLVAVSAASAGVALLVGDRRFVGGRAGVLLQYVWTSLGIGFGALLGASVEGGPLRFVMLFAVAAVASAGSYPRAGQLLMQSLTVVAVATSWLARPAGAGVAELVLVECLLVTLMYLIGALAADLRSSLEHEAAARQVVERRSRLLATVGRVTTLDIDDALAVVADAVVDLGFPIANVAVVRNGERYSIASRGLDPPPAPVPADSGVAGRALTTASTVVVADYRGDTDRLPYRETIGAAVAVPIRMGGVPRGVLVAAREAPGRPPGRDVETLELLALHVAQVLDNARRFGTEREVAARLRELDQLKRDFVGNVSHELRTPLTVVQGMARTLTTQGDQFGDDRMIDLIARMNANTTRLGTMLGGLLDFRRLDEGQLEARPRPVDLALLVRGAVDRLSTVLETHRVEVATPDSALALADPDLIEHVIDNLLVNVAKHTPAGTAVSVSVALVDGEVTVVVADDGPGVAADELELLTLRHFRGTGAEGSVPGSGVGLALVSDILEAHGSALEIRSRVGRGTDFSFRLPGVTVGALA